MSLNDMYPDEMNDIGFSPIKKKRKIKKPYVPSISLDEPLATDSNSDIEMVTYPIYKFLSKFQAYPEILLSTLRKAGFHDWIKAQYPENIITTTNFNKYKDYKLVDDEFLAFIETDKEANFKFVLINGTFTTCTGIKRKPQLKLIKEFLFDNEQFEFLVKMKVINDIGPSMLK